MTRSTPQLASFNAGELSPLLGSRPDLQKYQAGLSVCENFIPTVQGAAVRRGGTKYVAETKDSSKRSWLVPFVFAQDDAFVLEFGNTYVRFYRSRGVLLDGLTPYEIEAPWVTSELTSTKDGSFGLDITQSGDVLYIASPRRPPQKLTRRGNTDWVIEAYDPEGGPFKDQNEDETITVYATAVNVGDETDLVASADIFLPGHVGSLFYLQMQDGGEIKPWEVYQRTPADAVGDLVRQSDGKYYKLTAVGATADQYTGTEKPIHTSGKFWDGDGVDKDTDDNMGSLGVEWEYIHPGYGWVLISEVTDARHATGHVVSRLPEQVITAGDLSNTTWRWAHAAWSDVEGWPSSVAFFRDRLAWGQGQSVWFSQAGDYENFKAKDFGEQLPSSAFRVLVQSGRGDPIEWLAPTDALLVGTGGSVHAVVEAATSSAFGPTNARQKDQVMPGASGVQPVNADTILYVEKAGRIVAEAALGDGGTYNATDLTIYAEHVTKTGLTQLCWAKQPHAVVWGCRTDGLLVGMTLNKDQGVFGWHRHPIGGSGIVESVCTIPSPDGGRDDLWLLVRRTIDGQTVRYVEYMTAEYQDGDDQRLAAYADCHLTYSGAAVSSFTGLDHLEGQALQVKAGGASHANATVSAGAVSLDREVTRIVAGLSAPAKLMVMPLSTGSQLGTAAGKIKRINKLQVSLLNCLGGKIGPDFDTTQGIPYRRPTDAMDAPPPMIVDEDVEIDFPGDYDKRATIALLCDQGFPFTLKAFLPDVTLYEG